MAKYHGKVGYAIQKQVSKGVWQDVITERTYFGDVLRNNNRVQTGENLNDNLNVDNQISIVADPFAYNNFATMRYIEWMGARWKVVTVNANQRPRLILTIGGVYNDQTPGTS